MMMQIRCSNCGVDCAGECSQTDFDQLIKDGKPIEALRYFAKEGYENGDFGHTRKQLVDYAADKLEKQQGEARRITEQNDEIRSLKLEIKNLKKGIGKSSLGIWAKHSNVNARNKDAIKLLKSMNMAIDGIWGFACDNDYLFSTFNISSKAEETYKEIEREIGTELIKIAEKIEVMRSVVVGDSIDWKKMIESLEVD